MLDHVMLWIARVFVVISIPATVIHSFRSPDISVIMNCLAIGLSFLWLVCIWQYWRPTCRIILAISSLFLFLTFSLSHSVQLTFHYGIPMIGLSAILWTAIRAGSIQGPNLSNPDTAQEIS